MEKKVHKITKWNPFEKELPHKRVAAYARVSGDKEAMLHSLSAQVSYYSDKIQKTPGWVYAGVYADEATTGTKAARTEFQRMFADCRAGKIDMVITKSVSRFARNTLTTLEVVMELRAMEVDVYFEEQNLHTLSGDGEFLLTLLAVYAQEETRSVSDNMKWRIQRNYEQGLMWGGVRMYGYTYHKGTLLIDPNEAAAIQLAAQLYIAGHGGHTIAKALNAAGYFTKGGKPWRSHHIKALLFNEKLVGDLLLQKTYINDPLEKQVIHNHGERAQYLVPDSHEPILDREVQAMILMERDRRAARYQKCCAPSTEQHLFAGRIVCGNCGCHYRRKITHKGTKYERHVWICTTYNNEGASVCSSKLIPEAILYNSAAQAMGSAFFDATAFAEEIVEIRVSEPGVLLFIHRDGREIVQTWQNSRRDSWDDSMKEAARLRSIQVHAKRRGA